MSSLLRHYGLNISECMVFGLSSAMLFAHFPFVKVEGFPLTAYRAVPGTIIRALQHSLGVTMKKERFRTPAQATKRLDEHLDENRVVGIQASVYWLPYFPPDMRFHFNAHNLIVYGKEGNEYLISDPVGEHTVRCHTDDLQRARFAKGIFAPKGLIYYPTHVPETVNIEKAVAKAIRKTAFLMLKVPVPFIGTSAIHYLANKIRNLQNKSNDPRHSRLFVSFIIRMQEEIGTGGGGFRFIYASFLQEAAQMLNHTQLHEASEKMTVAGDAWREFALLGARYCKKKYEVKLHDLADALIVCADKETAAFRLIDGIRIRSLSGS